MKYIKNDSLPNVDPYSDDIVIRRELFTRFKKKYEGMLYFCSRITGIDQEKLTMQDLEHFEFKRFDRDQQYLENLSWPIDAYLDKIKELEEEIGRNRKK